MNQFSNSQTWFTYGPKTQDDHVLSEIIKSGATGVRLTFSFGTPELQIERAQQVRRIANEIKHDILIIGDLQGAKCRLGKIDNCTEVPVKAGQKFVLTRNQINLDSTSLEIPIQVAADMEKFEVGDKVIEGDGGFIFVVQDILSHGVQCISEQDGIIHPTRSLTVQKPAFRPEPLTQKDELDLAAIIDSEEFDAVAISFVGDAEDVDRVKGRISKHQSNLLTVAKVETRLGIDNIQEIAGMADIILAGRGDLALTMPWVELPASVNIIAKAASDTNTPWIVATQIMEGLERFNIPTRAEICDLANWMIKGAAGAMLSYETAFGPRAVDAVRLTNEVVKRYFNTASN